MVMHLSLLQAYYTQILLAWLFSKKTSRYRHSHVVGGGRRGCVVVVQKMIFANISVISERYFVKTHISWLLSKQEPMFYFTYLCPFFDLEFSLKINLFSNICVFAEDIYFKLEVVFLLSKKEPIPIGEVCLSVIPDPLWGS